MHGVPSGISNSQPELIISLVEKHTPHIRRYIASRSGPRVRRKATVDDIMQESLLAASKSAHTYQHIDDSSFLNWIKTIVRRVIHRQLNESQGQVHCQRIKGYNSTGSGVPANDLLSPLRSPSSFAAGDEKLEILMAAIQNLPPIHCKALKLYKLRQLTFAEVGRQIGKSEGHTSRIVAEAMEVLRAQLNSDEQS